LVASLDGRRLVRDEIQGLASDAEGIGRELAGRILGAGGRAILEEIERGS
jgi:hydroxymethylbilane synthase